MNRKVKHNLQNLGENKTGYRAENRIFSTDENFTKSLHLFTLLFYTPHKGCLGAACGF